MLKLITNILIYGTYLTVVGFLTFVLWQALFGSRDTVESHGKEQTTQSDQQNPGKQVAGSGIAPKPHNPAEEAIADYTRWLAIFTSLLVLATIALFVSGERNVEVARESADAAGRSAAAAKDAADAARDSVKLAERTAERQLRAYLTVESADLTLEGRTARVVLTVKNSGQTPAYQVRSKLFLKFDAANVPFKPDDNAAVAGEPLPGIVGPGGKAHPNSQIELPEPNARGLQSGDGAIYAWGRMDYVDVFNVPRYLKFGLRSIKAGTGWAFQPTPIGNDAN